MSRYWTGGSSAPFSWSGGHWRGCCGRAGRVLGGGRRRLSASGGRADSSASGAGAGSSGVGGALLLGTAATTPQMTTRRVPARPRVAPTRTRSARARARAALARARAALARARAARARARAGGLVRGRRRRVLLALVRPADLRRRRLGLGLVRPPGLGTVRGLVREVAQLLGPRTSDGALTDDVEAGGPDRRAVVDRVQQHGPLEVGAVEVRALEVRPVEPGALEVRAGEIGAGEDRAVEAGVLQVGAGEPRVLEVGSLECGAFEVGPVQPCALSVRAPQDGVVEVGEQQAGAPQVRSLEVGRPQVGLEQIGALEVRAAKHGTFEVRSGQHRAGEGRVRQRYGSGRVVGERPPSEDRHRGLDVGGRAEIDARSRCRRAPAPGSWPCPSPDRAVDPSGPRRVLAHERREDLDDRTVVLGRFLGEPLERVDAAETDVERGMAQLVDCAHEPFVLLALGVLAPAVARGQPERVHRHRGGERRDHDQHERDPDPAQLVEPGRAREALRRHQPCRRKPDHERAHAGHGEQAQGHQQEAGEPPPPA